MHPDDLPDAPQLWWDEVGVSDGVDALAEFGPEAFFPDALDLVREVDGMMAVFAAQRLARVDVLRREALADAALAGRTLSDVIARSLRLELAAGLRITEHAAADMLALAEALVHRYPLVLDSLGSARMSERHAQLIVNALDAVEPGLRDDLLARAVHLAETQAGGTLRRSLRILIDTTRAQTLAERHEEALEARRIVVEPADEGMAWLMAYLPAVEAHAIHGRLTAIGRVLASVDGETRSLDQVRADALCDLLIDGDTTLHPSDVRGIRATVAVTVPALSLLGDEMTDAATPPATVEGIGPIPLARAKELCGGATDWMRVLTHPESGMVLSVGRTQYRPPAALRKLVRWRAERCMAPGCGMPASRCEIDHNLAWEHGGPTALTNLTPICKGHHIVKHHGGWAVRQVAGSGGVLEWTSPAGRRYLVEPERRVPVFRPSADTAEAAHAPF